MRRDEGEVVHIFSLLRLAVKVQPTSFLMRHLNLDSICGWKCGLRPRVILRENAELTCGQAPN